MLRPSIINNSISFCEIILVFVYCLYIYVQSALRHQADYTCSRAGPGLPGSHSQHSQLAVVGTSGGWEWGGEGEKHHIRAFYRRKRVTKPATNRKPDKRSENWQATDLT